MTENEDFSDLELETCSKWFVSALQDAPPVYLPVDKNSSIIMQKPARFIIRFNKSLNQFFRKEYILRWTTPRPGFNSRLMPQRMYVPWCAGFPTVFGHFSKIPDFSDPHRNSNFQFISGTPLVCTICVDEGSYRI